MENAERFRTLLAEAGEDRMTAQRRFEEHQSTFTAYEERFKAQQARIDELLEALRQDRLDFQQRFEAQQDDIQALKRRTNAA